MTEESLRILKHIIEARADHYEETNEEGKVFWTLDFCRSLIDLAEEDNIEILRQFDYMQTKEERMRELD